MNTVSVIYRNLAETPPIVVRRWEQADGVDSVADLAWQFVVDQHAQDSEGGQWEQDCEWAIRRWRGEPVRVARYVWVLRIDPGRLGEGEIIAEEDGTAQAKRDAEAMERRVQEFGRVIRPVLVGEGLKGYRLDDETRAYAVDAADSRRPTHGQVLTFLRGRGVLDDRDEPMPVRSGAR